MEKQLHFSKSSNEASWGFRLIGGADFSQPLLVVKVNENGLAEKCGLEIGDIVVRINDCSAVKLTHSEVHELITQSGSDFIVGVRRGIVPLDIIHEGEVSIEFQDFLKGIQASVEEDILAEATQIVDKLNKDTSKKEKKMVFSNATQTQMSLEHEKAMKFSTFMMKPDKPVPKPKKPAAEPTPDNNQDSYKVVIKRQTLGRKFFKEKKVQFDQNITEVEIEARPEASQDHTPEETEDQEAGEETHEQYEEHCEEPSIDEESSFDEPEDFAEGATEAEQPPEVQYKPLSEIKVDSSSEFSMTLEEQLLAVQKQLQALSQLPSAIQMTLDAVSKQLASIVSAKEASEEREEYENGVESSSDGERECLEEASDDEARADGDRELNEASNSSLDGDFDDDSIAEEEIKAILERARLDEELEEVVEEPLVEISEEEKLAQMREQEMLAKKEKVGRWNDAWPWSDKVKPVYSESNCWMVTSEAASKQKINFLKFQPPAKNLDYLQRSEVYRLVHDMEPPVRGIVSRPEKVIPEQDYYEANKGSP